MAKRSGKAPMTPQEFSDAVRGLIEGVGGDPEAFHSEADKLMEELLSSLGYEEGVELIQSTTRWYA